MENVFANHGQEMIMGGVVIWGQMPVYLIRDGEGIVWKWDDLRMK